MAMTVYQVERGPGGKFRAMTKINIDESRKLKRRAYLRDWSIVQRDPNGSKWVQLKGRVYGHPRFFDGEPIVTSPVLKLNIPEGYAETMNSKYMLRDDRVDQD